MVCQTFKMLHLFLFPISFFLSHILCFLSGAVFSLKWCIVLGGMELQNIEPKILFIQQSGNEFEGDAL